MSVPSWTLVTPKAAMSTIPAPISVYICGKSAMKHTPLHHKYEYSSILCEKENTLIVDDELFDQALVAEDDALYDLKRLVEGLEGGALHVLEREAADVHEEHVRPLDRVKERQLSRVNRTEGGSNILYARKW
jgi:hypothetical protein